MPVKQPEQDAIALLRAASLADPHRLVRLIRQTIDSLQLDLSGLAVLTEAASGPFVVTPVLAALAGAERVLALTRSSRYASVEAVVAQTRALEQLCGVPGRVEIFAERDTALFGQADIVTNLGFVRPIDAAAVAGMRRGAVVPLMCEAWEYRQGDVDLAACAARGIPVIGTNEDFPGLEVFAYSGWLCQKLLFDAQVELHKSSVVVVSGDKFGNVITEHLSRCGVAVRRVANLRGDVDLAGTDAIVVADYSRDDTIIGPQGDVSASELVRRAPGATVVQFAGRIDVPELHAAGAAVYPGVDLPAHRMSVTLAGLGPRPVVELHAAGLKVGELAIRGARAGGQPLTEQARFLELMQPLSGGEHRR